MQNKVTELIQGANPSLYPIEPVCEYNEYDSYILIQSDKKAYRIVEIDNIFYGIGLFDNMVLSFPGDDKLSNLLQYGKIFRIAAYTGGSDGIAEANRERIKSIKELYKMLLENL